MHLPRIEIGLFYGPLLTLTLTPFHSTKLNKVNCFQNQTPVNMLEKHSKRFNRIPKKRKIVHVEEHEQTLNRGNVRSSSSNSKHFQSNSCKRHTNWKKNRVDSTNIGVHRNWSYSGCHIPDIRDKIILVSYNILGVDNASRHPALYFKVPFEYMKWDYRMAAIQKELAQYDPSILCFQEVDCYGDLHDALQKDGYEGVFKARTGDARDGCAIFWKNEQFKLLHEESIEFQNYGLRNNVAQFCVLEMNDDQLNPIQKMSKPTCRTLVVGNIHVLFNPGRGDIKLGQIRLFLERAHGLAKEWGGIPVVLGGDFNSVPESAAYQYISSAKLDILQHDRKKISGQIEMPMCRSFSYKRPVRQKQMTCKWTDEELKLATGSKEVTCLQHSLNLLSAYHGVPGNVTTRDNIGEPLATSCHSKFMGTVDYIWHSDQLVPVRVLETLSRNALENLGGLPSKNWGSDHLALVCEFAFASSET